MVGVKGESMASQMALVVKKLPANAGDVKRCRFSLWVGEILWRREYLRLLIFFPEILPLEWQPTPVFLPRESFGQRSLVGYGLQRHKESDMTETIYPAHKETMKLFPNLQ